VNSKIRSALAILAIGLIIASSFASLAASQSIVTRTITETTTKYTTTTTTITAGTKTLTTTITHTHTEYITRTLTRIITLTKTRWETKTITYTSTLTKKISLDEIIEKYARSGEKAIIMDVIVKGHHYKVILYYPSSEKFNKNVRVTGGLVIDAANLQVVPHTPENEILLQAAFIKALYPLYGSFSWYTDLNDLANLARIQFGLATYMYFGIRVAWALGEFALGIADPVHETTEWITEVTHYIANFYRYSKCEEDKTNIDIIAEGLKTGLKEANGIKLIKEIYEEWKRGRTVTDAARIAQRAKDALLSIKSGIFIGQTFTDLIFRSDLQAMAFSWLATASYLDRARLYQTELIRIIEKPLEEAEPYEILYFLSGRVRYYESLAKAFYYQAKMHEELLRRNSIWAIINNSKESHRHFMALYNAWLANRDRSLSEIKYFYDNLESTLSNYRG